MSGQRRRWYAPSGRTVLNKAQLLASAAKLAGNLETMPMWLTCGPAVRLDVDGAPDTVMSLVIEGGRISRIYAVRNPHRLTRLGEEATLSR